MSAEAPRAFLDTNVLVYAHDGAAGVKRERARELVQGLWAERRGGVSIQVLQELFVVATQRLPNPLDSRQAAAVVTVFARWMVHEPQSSDVIAAIDVSDRYRISFWDAMIVHSAAALGCDVLYTEDLNAGQRYDGVLVVDPFA